MAIKEIIRMGHPTLRQIAAPYPIEEIGSSRFVELINDLKDTLLDSGGIGLAAPQINIASQVLIIDVPDSGSRYGETTALPYAVYINPRISILNPETTG